MPTEYPDFLPRLAALAKAAPAELRAALLFLTRLPVGWSGPFPATMQQRCMLWFPVAGVCVGAIGAAALGLAVLAGLPPVAAALLAIAASIAVTGALHEDGLADVADGFGGGRTRDRKLEIMRDSQVGTYGVLALVLSVGLRAAALTALIAAPANVVGVGAGGAAAALIAAAAVSRAAMVAVAYWLVPARSDGVAAKAGGPSPRRLAGAGALTVLILVAALPPLTALAAVLAVAAATAALALLAKRMIGGYTGDVFGATQQIGEITCLLVLSAALQ